MQTSKVGKYKVEYNNKKEFRIISKEIFTSKIYDMDLKTDTPLIIDAGAHIGLATLYFKSLYPNSIITAIEPFKENFELLKNNVSNNNLKDITLINKALGKKNGTREFFIDNTQEEWFSTSSYNVGAWTGGQQNKKVEVETITLSNLLETPIDLLKLDIEGAEKLVLEEAKDKLNNIKTIIMEYHPISKSNGKKVVNLLENNGFQVKLFFKNKPVKQLSNTNLTMIKAVRI